MKRARGPRTIDIYPQTMSWNVTQASADAFVTQLIQTPISRLPKKGNLITVMELLYMDVVITNTNAQTPTYVDATSDNFQWGIVTGAAPSSFPYFSQPSMLAYKALTHLLTTSGTFQFQYPQRYEFEDGSGRGILLATDAFTFVADTNGTGVVNRFDCKLLYRFVDVSVEEYVGIVQSQQTSS